MKLQWLHFQSDMKFAQHYGTGKTVDVIDIMALIVWLRAANDWEMNTWIHGHLINALNKKESKNIIYNDWIMDDQLGASELTQVDWKLRKQIFENRNININAR